MIFDDVQVIYGFPDGKTVVSYKTNGSEAVIGGADGTGIKVYDTNADDQEYTHTDIAEHSESITCVATSKTGVFASGSVDGLVLLYTKDDKFDKILVRSVASIRDLGFHPNGSKLAIATDEPTIRIVLTTNNSKIVQLEGHNDSVKSVSYDPSGNYLLSSDVKGNIRIWNVSADEPVPRCIKILPGYTYKSDVDSVLQAKVAWNPDNTCFAFTGTNNNIRVFRNDIWAPFYSLDGEHTRNVITFAWSPNGYYLASSSEDNSFVIWDVKEKKPIAKHTTSTYITGIAWHSYENEITLTDAHGQIRIWKEVIPTDNSNYPHPAILRNKTTLEPTSEQVAQKEKTKNRISNSSLFDDDDDDEEEAIEDQEEGDDVAMVDEEGEDIEDFVIDDDGAGYAETAEDAEKNKLKLQSRLNLENIPNNKGLIQRLNKVESMFEPPPSFQPGETPYHKPEPGKPFDPQQGERRYMAYNLIGAISTVFEDGHSVINVEFHDQSEYRNFHFTDVLNFSIGAISSVGAVFAVEGKESEDKPKKENDEDIDDLDNEDINEEEENENKQLYSTLYFRPNKMGTNKDWTHYMLPGEDIITVAINQVSVIATTSLGYVRIFSISGIQKHLFSLENVVTMTAMTDLVFIVYSDGPAFENQQNLRYILMNTNTYEILQKDKIQLTTESTLNWVGFSETNQACTYDSQGILRVLYHQRRPYQGRWIPVFDGKAYAGSQQKTEKYWPVGVLRDRLMCVVIRGSNLYPFFPRPPVKDIPLRLPLLESSTEVGQLEEQILRIETCNFHERDEAEATNTEEEYVQTFHEADIEMDIAILKLINLACKSEKVGRALDLTYTLHTSESIDKAVKIALFHHYTSLAEKIARIKETKFINDEHSTPSTLADSLGALPNIHSSTQPTLSSDLSFVKKQRGKEYNGKRSISDEDSIMSDVHTFKRSKGFDFSQ
ncbi:WD40-repeat-containing domain protein [Cokeromyces recurvatus]|uniref:WD40-repeat-containing domain protein n=1 Tax=Cokeromyces recurvatus TaxID=90255 RepID=UPI00221F2DDA|nr:WD40-repeat-containing domain protein [Cokeromyces recurvatus]KAI7901299.1 WD40-repeat-containing domain protein [Cokeromyces recurvatus]